MKTRVSAYTQKHCLDIVLHLPFSNLPFVVASLITSSYDFLEFRFSFHPNTSLPILQFISLHPIVVPHFHITQLLLPCVSLSMSFSNIIIPNGFCLSHSTASSPTLYFCSLNNIQILSVHDPFLFSVCLLFCVLMYCKFIVFIISLAHITNVAVW